MPLDNDIGFLLLNDMPKRCAVWRTAGPERRVTAVRAERIAPQAVRVTVESVLPAANSPYSTTYTVYGRGPHENYWNRHSGAPVGRYSDRVDQLIHDYVRPQENGNRTDVRWIALTDADGAGLLAVVLPHLSVSAWPYTMQDLETATRINELPRRDTITVNLDYRQTGVGGDDGWGARPHAEYTLNPRSYAYHFRRA